MSTEHDDPGGQAPVGARGILLLVLAVGLGVLLLQAFDRGAVPFAEVDTDTRPTTTTTTPDTVPSGGAGTTTTLPAREPSEVTLLAANGTATAGLATRVSEFLEGLGYTDTVMPTDVVNKPVEMSRVEHKEGFEREASAVAQLLKLPATAVQEVTEFEPVGVGAEGVDLLVVIGSDLDRPLAE